MPRIPFSTSRARVPQEHVGVDRHGAGRAAGELASGLAHLSEQLDKAHQAHQISEAQNAALDQTLKLKQEAEQKPYHEAPDYFKTGFDKIKTNIRQNYGHVWNKIQPSIEKMGIVQSNDVQQQAFHKQQNESVALFNKNIDSLSQLASTATNPTADKVYKDEIRATGQNAVEGGYLTATQAQSAVQHALSSADYLRAERLVQSDPESALKAINGALPDLDPQHRISLRDKAQAAIKSKQREAQVRLHGRLQDDLYSIQTQGTGVPGINHEMKALGYSAQQIKSHEEAQHVAYKAYYAHQSLKFATPDGMKAELGELKPKAGSKNYHEKWQIYQKAQTEAQRITKARHEDPAGYVDSVKPPDPNASMESQIETRMTDEAAMGIQDRKPLPKSEAANMVSHWSNANPQDKVAMVDQWKKQTGRYFNSVLGQLTDHHLPTMAVLMTNADPITRDDEAQVSDMKMSDLKKLVPNSTQVETAIHNDSGWTSFVSTLPPNAPQKLSYQQDVTKLALLYASRGSDPQKASHDAVQNALMAGHNTAGTIRVPNEYNADQVQSYASHLLDQLPNNLDTRGLSENQFKVAAKSGKWITNPDETGAVLYVNNAPVRKKDGSLFEFDFNDAENYHPERKTSAPQSSFKGAQPPSAFPLGFGPVQ